MTHATESAGQYLDFLEGNGLGIEDVLRDPTAAADPDTVIDLLLDKIYGVDGTDPDVRCSIADVLEQRGYLELTPKPLNEVSAGPVGTPFDTAASKPGPSTIGPRSDEDRAYNDVSALLQSKFKKLGSEDLAALEAMSPERRRGIVMRMLGLDTRDDIQWDTVKQLLPRYMKSSRHKLGKHRAVGGISEAHGDPAEEKALARPADVMVSKREKLDAVKERMRSVTDTLQMTVDGLQDDIPMIGGRGVTLNDLHGAVVSLMRGADELLDHIEALAALREVRLREGWDDTPDLMAMTYEQLEQLHAETDDESLRDSLEREMEDRKVAYSMGGHRGAR